MTSFVNEWATNKQITKRLNNYWSHQPNKQQIVYKKQPAVSKTLKKFPCSVQCFIPPCPAPDKSNPPLSYLLFPKQHLYFWTHRTCYMALPFHSPLFHQPVEFGKQYKSWCYPLYNILQLSIFCSFLCLTFPQPDITIGIVLENWI